VCVCVCAVVSVHVCVCVCARTCLPKRFDALSVNHVHKHAQTYEWERKKSKQAHAKDIGHTLMRHTLM